MKYLLLKEFTLEFRRKTAVAGLALYLLSMTFVVYLTIGLRQQFISPQVWSALFWITILFTAINSVAKSFIGEKKGLDIYYYTLARPESMLLAKTIYNFLLCLVLSFSAYGLYILFLNNPVENQLPFMGLLVLTSLGFAAALTLLSGIAAKASSSHVLMAILSFPVVISILLIAIKVTKQCLDGIAGDVSGTSLLTLAAIDALVMAVSYVLFPYTWKN